MNKLLLGWRGLLAVCAMLAMTTMGFPNAAVAGAAANSASLFQVATTTRIFPQTGKSIEGLFLEYWTANGGLLQQGYPISDEMPELSQTDGKVYTVQYFERAVFELHPENPAPYTVLLSLVGTQQYLNRYPSGAPGQEPDTSAGAVQFAETGHSLSGVFLSYWQQHGGVLQQGYPISDPFTEVSPLDGLPYTVQYFQRAVFELHPENAPPYNVLLSQLGTFSFAARYGAANLPNTGGTGSTTDPTGTTGDTGTGGSGGGDVCSGQASGQSGSLDFDGCLNHFDSFVATLTGDINNYWSQVFAARDKTYTAPAAITPYTTRIRTACGTAALNNAFFCQNDNTIYFDSNFVQTQISAQGVVLVDVILAHEWGHLLQKDLGIFTSQYRTIDIELQADCLAGVWFKHADAAGALKAGDVQVAAQALYNAGDPPRLSPNSSQAHGSPQQREDSFNGGYAQGVEACPLAGTPLPLQ